MLVVALTITFTISTFTARDYLRQQLHLKNQDNVNALALSISQFDKDLGSLELLISAQFDSGHYQYIRINDPNGMLIIERVNPPLPIDVPQWFQHLVPIKIEQGTAPIQNGWSIFGTLELQSHSRFAYQSMWQQTQQLSVWFIGGLLLSGWLGSLILKRITRPLNEVIAQAQAIGQRKFIRIDEPKTLEFRAVVSAMNQLSSQVEQTLAEEEQRLEQLRQQAHYDSVTGLLNRQQFVNQLKTVSNRENTSGSGTLIIARFSELEQLNSALGRQQVDQLLGKMGQKLDELSQQQPDWIAGRLNGTDLSLLASGQNDVHDIAQQVADHLQQLLTTVDHKSELMLPVGATVFEQGDSLSAILSRTDNALAAAEQKGASTVEVIRAEGYSVTLTSHIAWREALETAIKLDTITLGQYPVINMTGNLLHMEAPSRVLIDNNWCHAGIVIPFAASSGLLPQFDQFIITKALANISDNNKNGAPQGINLSHQAMCDSNFRQALIQQLKQSPQAANKLWLEISEYGAYRNFDEFKQFCHELKPFGCKIGLEHVGTQFSRLSKLHDLGLDYLKVNAALIRDIDNNQANQTLLRNLCTIAHTIGLIVIAEGVESSEEQQCLAQIGLDGMTGPGITLDNKEA